MTGLPIKRGTAARLGLRPPRARGLFQVMHTPMPDWRPRPMMSPGDVAEAMRRAPL